jgi:DNA replication protein DnaC
VAGNDHEDALRKYYPDAVEVVCHDDEGRWATITYADGVREGKCPACARDKLAQSVMSFIPLRFRATVTLPADVDSWARRGMDAQGLYLAGQVGTGKTHTAWHAAATWCVVTGTVPSDGKHSPYEGRFTPTVIFTRMTDLLDDLRPGDDARQRVRDCQNCKLLILDDVGAEKASEWTQERLYSIIDDRYANCRPLIVTSNLPPTKIGEQTGARTESRLAEMCEVVPLVGADRRKPAAA